MSKNNNANSVISNVDFRDTLSIPIGFPELPALRAWLDLRDLKADGNAHYIEYASDDSGVRFAKCLHISGLTDWDWEYLFHTFGLRKQRPATHQSDKTRPSQTLSARLNVGEPIYTKRQANSEKRKLDKAAERNRWTAPQLGARKAWVTMRTVGWSPKTTNEEVE